MQPRHAAFTMLRRLALQGIRTAPRNLQKWNSPAMRLLHYHPTRKLLSSKLGAQKSLDGPVKATEETETIAPDGIAPVNSYFLLTFTCKPCNTRSTHKVTRVGYHCGSVLITCPECKNRHIISDHLKVGRVIPPTLMQN
jgi:mitochondrial protein import protein ZIM17